MIRLDRDEWIISRWQTRPPVWDSLEEQDERVAAPPLWKDLLVACGFALLLWAVAAAFLA
jgi:hypothetical protein